MVSEYSMSPLGTRQGSARDPLGGVTADASSAATEEGFPQAPGPPGQTGHRLLVTGGGLRIAGAIRQIVLSEGRNQVLDTRPECGCGSCAHRGARRLQWGTNALVEVRCDQRGSGVSVCAPWKGADMRMVDQ